MYLRSRVRLASVAKIRVEHLRKAFVNGKMRQTVVDDVSIEVQDGEFLVLVGPSGCGKTTTLRMIAGLETADAGQIYIGDRNVGSVPARDRNVAMVFQDYALYPHMSVFENLAFSLRARKAPRAAIDERVHAVAALMRIEPLLARRPKELSGGQRQRVAVGRALVREPAVFLFDEPLSNLDAQLRTEMRVELAELHRRVRATMLYVTHDQVEAMTLGQRIVVMNGGRVVQIDTPRHVYDRPADTFVARFIGAPAMNLLEGEVREGAFVAEGISLALGAAGAWRGPVTLGLRPEALQRSAEGALRGTLRLVEHVGADSFLHVDVGGRTIVARATYFIDDAPLGSAIALAADMTRALFFETTSGALLVANALGV